MFLLVTAALLAFAIFYWYATILRGSRLAKMLDKFPSGSRIPFVGSTISVLLFKNSIYGYTLDAKARYGPRVVMYIGWKPYLLLSSPEDIELVLGSKDHLEKAATLYGYFDQLFGNGLLTAKGKGWRPLRKLSTPIFYNKQFENYIVAQNDVARKCAESLEKFSLTGTAVDTVTFIQSWTAKIIIENLVGSSAESYGVDTQDLVAAVNRLLHDTLTRILTPWLHWEYLWDISPPGKRMKFDLEHIKDIFQRILDKRRGELGKVARAYPGKCKSDAVEDEDDANATFLDMLLEKAQEGAFLDEDLINQMITMIGAGYDTTGISLSWLLYNLGRNPEHQATIHQEFDRVFRDDPDRDITSTDLKQLYFLDACIKESLRLTTTVPFVGRRVDSDIQLSKGAVIPKGCEVIIHIQGVLLDPEIYPNPMKFDPSRFYQENEFGRHKYAFIPFSGGPRNCIGMQHAYTQMKCLVVHILRKYTVSAHEDMDSFIFSPSIVYQPKDGINITFHRRS